MDVPLIPAAPYNFVKPVVVCEPMANDDVPVNVTPKMQGQLGGAFSIMCTLRLDSLTPWARIFDFSNEADKDSITAGVVESSNDLHFTVFEGGQPVSVRVYEFFEIGREVTVLCTVSSHGHMKVFKDGLLVGENVKGVIPKEMDRPSMLLGGHFEFREQKFCGAIYAAKLWKQEVSWPMSQQVLLDKLGSSFLKPGARLLMEVVEDLDPHSGHVVVQVYAQEDSGLDGDGRWAYAGKVMLKVSMDHGAEGSMSLYLSDTIGAESDASTTTPTTGTPHHSPRDSQI